MESAPVSQERIKVLLADDHVIIRQALKMALEKRADFVVVAEASNGHEAIELTRELSPDVVLMDIGMPELNGIEATRKIRELYPDIIIFILTVYNDIEHALSVLEAGADGYLTKNTRVEDVVKAISTAVHGDAVISGAVFKEILNYSTKHTIKDSFVNNADINMTEREIEVLKLIAAGKSNKEISAELNMNLRTVKSSCANIFCKLKVFSRTEAAITALRCGIITLDNTL